MRFRLVIILSLLLASSALSSATPGGEGDEIRSMGCGGSCHGDPGQNGISSASIELEISDEIWSGLLTTITIHVNGSNPSESRLVGAFLLTNDQGAKDTPAHDGWQIIADPNGGLSNYVEMESSRGSDSLSFTWTLRAPQGGQHSLMAAIHHGSDSGGIAFIGKSPLSQISVVDPPENLPRLSGDFSPPANRDIGEQLTITLETENVDSFIVEYRLEGGTPIDLAVKDGKFTLPVAVNAGVIEWRALLEGEGPDQTTPWFRVVTQEDGWQVDEPTLFLQGFALLILGAGLVLLQRPTSDDENLKKYDQTPAFSTGELNNPSPLPPIPVTGLPAGWNMEQWQHYGQQYLDDLVRGGSI